MIICVRVRDLVKVFSVDHLWISLLSFLLFLLSFFVNPKVPNK